MGLGQAECRIKGKVHLENKRGAAQYHKLSREEAFLFRCDKL